MPLPSMLPFLGLPYRLGAAPADGAADCLQLTLALLHACRQPAPAPDHRWYELAAAGEWEQIRQLVMRHTVPTIPWRDHAVVLLKGPGKAPGDVGFGVAWAGGVITTTPERGSHWRQQAECSPIYWFRFLERP